MKRLEGVAHGRSIELRGDSGIEEGREVEVFVQTRGLPGPPPDWRPDGTESAAGRLADSWTDDDDRILQEIYEERQRSSGRELVE
jgi:hypothetical protein